MFVLGNVWLCHRNFCHLRKSVDNDTTYEENFPASKILVSFINMVNLLQIKL